MNLVILVAAIVIAVMVFAWLVNVVKATIKTAVAIAAIVLVMLLLFGVGPGQIWQQLSQLFQALWKLVTGSR